jgi:hypothetical protein
LLRPLLASQNRRSPHELDELARQQPVAAPDPEFSKKLFELTHEIHETWNQEDSTTTTTNDLPLNMSLSEALATLPQHAKAMGWSTQEISELTQIVQPAYQNNFNQSNQPVQNKTSFTTPWPTTKVFLDELWRRLEDLIVPLPISLQDQLRQTFQIITNRLAKDESLPAAIWQDLLRLLRPLLASQNRHSSSKLDELARQQPVAAPDSEFSKELFELTHKIHETLNQENSATTTTDDIQFDLSFSEADELYINNAGLVILWPFLSHFFTHLDLLAENKQFKNLATMQRAVALLQYLAIENDNFPEYWLALNKVLCGMAITDVYHLDSPLLESEMSECTTLLKAVIAQAPILRDMSESGLRGTFLLRAGVLSTRDGAWLLRVERETYDIVLDRFPWSWVWVKLPWMEAPLRVEWS